jgi:hypothetical protein
MRKTLLATTAAIALIAMPQLAPAQTQNRGAPGPAAAPGATAPKTAPTPNSAPAEIQGTPDHDQAGPGHNKGARDTTHPAKQRSTQQMPGKGTPQSTEQNPGADQHNRSATDEHNRSTTEHNRSTADRDRGMTSRNVSLSTEQKTTIRQKVLTSSAPRVQGHVNFDIKIGVVVPRTVRVAPVPATLVEIEPQWRGYMYFVSGDEIIVVEPNSLRIVAVLDV